MKKITKIFAIAILVLGSSKLVKSQESEQISVQLSDPSKPGSLDIGLVFGSIKVVSYIGKEVIINATAGHNKKERNQNSNTNINTNININDRGNGTGNSNGMRKLSSNGGFELNVSQKNNKVDVSVDRPNIPVHLVIKVPQKFSLNLSTVNSGDISVENVDGNHEIQNVNGGINMTGIDGSVVANTVNGPLVVSLNSVTSSTPMAFSTVNGVVDVTFPANFKANVKLSSTFGDVFTDFDIEETRETKIKTSASKENGMYKISKDDSIQGKINGGGPELMMKSLNGKILLRKKK
jgi:Putative adhesin